MQNSKVFDFFTKKSIQEISSQNYSKNDELTNHYGVYLGALTKQDSHKIRNLILQLDYINEQINRLNEEWNQLDSERQELLQYCLNYLESGIPEDRRINMDKDELMISKDGHTWVLYNHLKQEKDAF